MGRAPCCEKEGMRKGAWTPEEDRLLISYVKRYGHGNWRNLPKQAGLLRCGKSCRLRWINYLRPDIKRGNLTAEEENTIIRLHEEWGNKWSAIAAMLPGRTDNEIKNVWNTHLKKRVDNHTSHQPSHQGRRPSKKERGSGSGSGSSSTAAVAPEDTDKGDRAENRNPVIKIGNAENRDPVIKIGNAENRNPIIKNGNADNTLDSELNEEFWAQVCSPEAVLPMAADAGFELLSPYTLPPPPPLSDYADIAGFDDMYDVEDFWDGLNF